MDHITGAPHSSSSCSLAVSTERQTFAQRCQEIFSSLEETDNWMDPFTQLNAAELSEEHLIEAIALLQEEIAETSPADQQNHRRMAFELQDLVLRKAEESSEAAARLIALAEGRANLAFLVNAIEEISLDRPVLELTGSAGEGTAVFAGAQMERLSGSTDGAQRILHAAMEYRGAAVGGVSAVTTGLLAAQNREGVDASIITPLYDVYINTLADDLEFVCTVNHPYKGEWIKSSIYKKPACDEGPVQYFAKPDLPYAQYNDIGTQDRVYETTQYVDGIDRWALFESVAAAFSASYVGEDRESPFSILHFQHRCVSLASELVATHYNTLRQQAGIESKLGLVGHIHAAGIWNQGIERPSANFRDLGLEPPLRGFRSMMSSANVSTRSIRFADAHICVSEWTRDAWASREISGDIVPMVQQAIEQRRFVGIRNGITWNSRNPANAEVYGQWAYEQTIESGVDTTDYLAQRAEVKESLFEAGVIASRDKPLFLYVGRYDAHTKGIDALPAMVEKIHAEGGQCVVMGCALEGETSRAIIQRLQRFQEEHPETLKVYTDLRRDQLSHFERTNVRKGDLIRLATDYTMVPSHTEADGLVPKEMLAVGSLLVTSNVEGLQDTVRGMDDTVNGQVIRQSEFNAFTYKDDMDFKENGARAVERAMEYERSTSKRTKNQAIARLIEDTKRHDWTHSVTRIQEVYQRAVEERSAEHDQALVQAEQTYYTSSFSNRNIFRELGKHSLRAVQDAVRRVKAIAITLFHRIGDFFRSVALRMKDRIAQVKQLLVGHNQGLNPARR